MADQSKQSSKKNRRSWFFPLSKSKSSDKELPVGKQDPATDQDTAGIGSKQSPSFGSTEQGMNDSSPTKSEKSTASRNNTNLNPSESGELTAADYPVLSPTPDVGNLEISSATSTTSENVKIGKKKSTLKKALSTTIPIFSWLRSGQNNQSTINPILHLATVALNADAHDGNQVDLHPESTSTIHKVLSDAYPATADTLWTLPDEESSIESFNSIDEQGFKHALGSDNTSEHAAVQKTEELTNESGNNSTEDLPAVAKAELTIEEKLQRVFDLPELDPYVTEFACWFVKSVLLKGYMYLTKNHICFYAQIPVIPGTVKKQAYLQKKSRRAPRAMYYRYWFVLKSDGLYLYSDASKPYFPSTTIYLKNVINVRPSSSKNSFKVLTTKKTYYFKADSELQLKEWVDALNSAVIHAKQSENDVLVVLPYSSISDISIVPTEFNCDALKVTAVCEETIKPEEYFFSYFNNVEDAHKILKETWERARGTKLIPKRSQKLLYRSPQGSAESSPVSDLSPSPSMPNVADQLPPKLEKVPSIIVSDHLRVNPAMQAPLSVPIFPSNPDLEFKEVDRRKSADEKRRSWWSTTRKSLSDDGLATPNDDMERKEEDFKNYFAVAATEKLISSSLD
jgi:hypothetical protein